VNVLGIIAYSGPAAACLVRDGKVLCGAREDRFTRSLRDRDFPRNAIAYCLRAGKIGPQGVDIAAIAGNPDEWAQFTRSLEPSQVGGVPWRKRLGSWLVRKPDVSRALTSELDPAVELRFVDELDAQAHAAFRTSAFGEAAILIAGFRSIATGRGGPGGIELDTRTEEPSSFATDLESATLRVQFVARKLRESTGLEALAMAGPLAARPELVGELHRAAIFRELWIHPAAGGGAGAVGAALRVAAAEGELVPASHPIRTLGPGYNSHQIRTFLRSREIFPEELTDAELTKNVAALLAQGQRVGWYQGRLEFSEHPIASRSILRSPTHGDRDPLDAVCVPAERAATLFELTAGAPPLGCELLLRDAWDSLFGDPNRPKRARAVFLAERELHRELHHLLETFREATGHPALLASPLRRAGEPIACTPADAFEVLESKTIDALALGSFVVHAKDVTQRQAPLTEGAPSREIG
jgi:carbamoyltransferase